MTRTWRFTIATLGTATLAVIMFTDLGEHLGASLEPASWLSGTLSLLVAFTALILALPSTARRHRVCTPEQLESAATSLSQLGGIWVRNDLKRRQLIDPKPITIKWSRAASTVTDTSTAQPSKNELGSEFDANQTARALLTRKNPRLVVLGPPGAGKSTLLLLLTSFLQSSWKPGERVPVLLNLTGWNPQKENLNSWIARRISEEFPTLRDNDLYGPKAPQELVERDFILPILDGLDEVSSPLQEEALNEINRTLHDTRPLILSCRISEFRKLTRSGKPIQGGEVRQIEPVPTQFTVNYLKRSVKKNQEPQWENFFNGITEDPNGPIALALSTPLMTFLMRTLYAKDSPSPLPLEKLADRTLFPSRKSVEDHLLDQFVAASFSTEFQVALKGTKWPAKKAHAWLKFLASHMDKMQRSHLAWWQLPETLSRPHMALLLSSSLILTFGSLGSLGLISGISEVESGSREEALLWTLAFTAIAAISTAIGTLTQKEGYLRPNTVRFTGRPRKLLRWSWAGVRIATALLVPTLIIYAVFYYHDIPDNQELAEPAGLPEANTLTLIAVGAATGLVLGILVGLVVAFTCWAISAARQPLRSIHLSSPEATLTNDIWSTITAFIIIALAVWGFGTSIGVDIPFEAAFVWFGVPLAAGFNAVLWFRIAHLWLAMTGKLPWRLFTFLRDAQTLGIIRQSGAVYQFRHARLIERLIATQTDSGRPS